MRSGHHVISVSLGGPAKSTGLAVVEPRSEYRYRKGDESELEPPDNYFNVRWLERLPLGREYPAILSRVRHVISQKGIGRDHTLLVDISASGLAAIRFFEREGFYPEPFRVSDAETSTFQDEVCIVPRRDMITAAQVIFQLPRLRVSDELDLAANLLNDLQSFDPEAPNRSQNADLVTAVAMAVWWGKDLLWCEEVGESMLSDGDELADYDRDVYIAEKSDLLVYPKPNEFRVNILGNTKLVE